jgi:hypothetical protein
MSTTTTTTRSVEAIVQEITIKAPASRVFEALIDPAQRMKWWGQKGRFETTNVESDLRPGGRWLMSGMGMGRPFKVETNERLPKSRSIAFGGVEMSSPMKLYSHSLAPNPRRVRIFAAEKGINLTLEDVDILAGQSRTPEFLAKNSSGAVPVLELDDGSHLSESVAICRYLEGLHPEPNLLGRDLREQADIERWNRRPCSSDPLAQCCIEPS